jgi:uncharacterized caspase-like protein
MSSPNRRQLFTGAAAYAAGAAIVAGGAALASEAHGATIDRTLAMLIRQARTADKRVADQEAIVDRCRAIGISTRAAVDLSNALNDAFADALDEVAHHPVSTAADLNTKLAFMREHHMGDGRDWLDTISQDVARIVEARA